MLNSRGGNIPELQARLNVLKFKTLNLLADRKSSLACLKVYSITIIVTRVQMDTLKVMKFQP